MATTVFNSEAVNLNNVTVNNVTVTVTDSATGRTALVSYTAHQDQHLHGPAGHSTTAINGSATAQAGLR